MPADNPTGRFSSRVEDYVKFRPAYPPQLLRIMAARCGFEAASNVADIGSGTGILSELMLKNGNQVFCVEPNAEMRAAAQRTLAGYAGFISQAATAEATELSGHSVDFITAGQAFHWFDRVAARKEFARILKPTGWIVLVWNDRRMDGTPFLREYEELLQRFGTDYATVRRQWDLDLEQFRAFTGSDTAQLTTLDNEQPLDLTGLRGRLLSSSYTPERGHPTHDPMLSQLETIFERHQTSGLVTMVYETKIYCSQLSEPGSG